MWKHIHYTLILMCLSLGLIACDHSQLNASDQQTTPKKMQPNYALLYALSDFRYQDIAPNAHYFPSIALIDPDDSQLTKEQISTLKAHGTTVLAYLSIGEAERYRSYWQNWEASPPPFLLHENKKWKGNFLVKFWDPVWQDIILKRAREITDMGYDGLYLDIVDGYQNTQVRAVYSDTPELLRLEMERFVSRISGAVKNINPNMYIIPQNAVELVADPHDSALPNASYLNVIDGLGVEDLWYDDNEVAEWTRWDLAKIRLAREHGKFVLATSYPSDKAKQEIFVQNALKEGLIPFAGKRSLSRKAGVYQINQSIPSRLPSTTRLP